LPGFELGELRKKALPADAVLIDVGALRDLGLYGQIRQSTGRRPVTVAWITPANGPVQLVDLGAGQGDRTPPLSNSARRTITP